jgi:Ca2+-binding EF-hand superfamily protein
MNSFTRAIAGALMAGLAVVVFPAPSPAVEGLPAALANEQEHYQRRMERLLRQLDSNGDGRLDRQEASRNRYLQRHFDRLDQDGKGYLVPADLR